MCRIVEAVADAVEEEGDNNEAVDARPEAAAARPVASAARRRITVASAARRSRGEERFWLALGLCVR